MTPPAIVLCSAINTGTTMLALHACDSCDKTFRTRSRLSNHNRKEHQPHVKVKFLNGTVTEIMRGSDGTFSCQCGRVFSHPGSLHTHAKQCGTVERDEVVEFGDGGLQRDEDDASEMESGGEGTGISDSKHGLILVEENLKKIECEFNE